MVLYLAMERLVVVTVVVKLVVEKDVRGVDGTKADAEFKRVAAAMARMEMVFMMMVLRFGF